MTVPIKINIYFFRFEELSQSVTILGADKKGLSIPHTIRQEIRTNFKFLKTKKAQDPEMVNWNTYNFVPKWDAIDKI